MSKHCPVSSIPVPNIFIRTGIFGSFTKNELSPDKHRDEQFVYQKGAIVTVTGANLNLSYDLPLLMLAVHYWKYKNPNPKTSDRKVSVPLNYLMGLRKSEKPIQHAKDCTPFVNSIKRLKTAQIIIVENDQKSEIIQMNFLEPSDSPALNYQQKCLEMTFSEDFVKYYKKPRCTYINFETYFKLSDQLSQALFLYLESQSYIDFTFKKLCDVTGLNATGRTSTDAKKREKLVAVLKKLAENEVVEDWYFEKSKNQTAKGNYRILPVHQGYTQQEIENIRKLPSNFGTAKSNKDELRSKTRPQSSL
ncbi:hypothetical protein [Paraglaciecola sp.]|uniref:hypothetical protein n=1 Tax=Paraglaciecola sp. TaxID=1920173 RepID=UPI003EF98B89